MSLRSMHRRLDFVRGPAPDLIMRGAIDRPPQETRDQWIDRMAAKADGRPYTRDGVNADGETYAQWAARRLTELAAIGGRHESL
jgi:hypothetical protein